MIFEIIGFIGTDFAYHLIYDSVYPICDGHIMQKSCQFWSYMWYLSRRTLCAYHVSFSKSMQSYMWWKQADKFKSYLWLKRWVVFFFWSHGRLWCLIIIKRSEHSVSVKTPERNFIMAKLSTLLTSVLPSGSIVRIRRNKRRYEFGGISPKGKFNIYSFGKFTMYIPKNRNPFFNVEKIRSRNGHDVITHSVAS